MMKASMYMIYFSNDIVKVVIGIAHTSMVCFGVKYDVIVTKAYFNGLEQNWKCE
jgi:hypothetical protein